MIAAAVMLAATMSVGVAPAPVPAPVQGYAGGYPQVEAYRLCGVRNAARLDRERPADPADVLARNATLQCDTLLGPAAAEVQTKGVVAGNGARIMAEFRQRSIADLAHKITTLRASRK